MVTSLIWCHTRMPPQCLRGGRRSNNTPPSGHTYAHAAVPLPRHPRRAWSVRREVWPGEGDTNDAAQECILIAKVKEEVSRPRAARHVWVKVR